MSTIEDLVFSFDRDGRVLYANRHLVALWGLQPGQERGKALADLGYPVGDVGAPAHVAPVREAGTAKGPVVRLVR